MKSGNLDLLPFLESLRGRGWTVGVDQYVTAHHVALSVLPTAEVPQVALRLALGPVFCRTPQDQIDFGQAFDEWWSPPSDNGRRQPAASTPRPPTRRTRRVWALVLEVVLPLSVGLILINAKQWLALAAPAVEPFGAPSTKVAFYAFAVALIMAIGAVLLVRSRNRRVLRNAHFDRRLEERLLPVIGVVSGAAGMQRIARQMRVQRVTESYVLDIDRSIEATARAVGWFTPVIQPVRSTPAYLFLIARDSPRDHVAAYTDAVARHLRQAGVHLDAYDFRSDPRLVWSGTEPPISLASLAERHASHRLILVMDVAALVDQVTTNVQPWVDELSAWRERAIVVPATPDEWSARRLESHGFLSASLGLNGLERLAEKFNGNRIQAPFEADSRAHLPGELRATPWLWRDRRPPDRENVERLVSALRRELTPSLFTWLKACAVYPSLQPELTRHLGSALGIQQYDADFLALARLPWFRRGSMPQWLRERLVLEMTRDEERRVRDVLKDLFLTMIRRHCDERRLFTLRIATVSSVVGRWVWRRLLSDLISTRPADDVLRDRVMLDVLRGRKLDRLSVVIPRKISSLLMRARRLNAVHNRKKPTSSWTAFFRSRRGGEIAGIFILTLAICLGLSLITYNNGDASAFYTPAVPVTKNWIGYYGATVAWLMYGFFGFAGFLLPAALFLTGWKKFWGQDIGAPIRRVIGLTLLMTASLPLLLDAALGRVFLHGGGLPSGGYVGEELNRLLSGRLSAAAVIGIAIVGVVVGTFEGLQLRTWFRSPE